MKVQFKSPILEAEQWWPPSDPRHIPNLGIVSQGPDDQGREGLCGCVVLSSRKGGLNPHIHTKRWPVDVHPGDWIITNPGGDKEPIRDDLFRVTYQKVASTWAEVGAITESH